MDEKKHRQLHVKMHKTLDAVIADFMKHTDRLPSKTPIIELLEWSYQQTIQPDEIED